MKQITERLRPGMDLKKSILAAAGKHKLKAAIIGCGVGSLRKVQLRLTVKNGAPVYKTLTGDFEIVSLTGTVSKGGESGHLHIAVSDEKGQVTGGHLMDGCLVKTTVELILLSFTDTQYTRRPDPETGFAELCASRN